MDNVAQFALVTLTSLLFIVDPIAVVPAYLVITRGETPAEQRRTAMRACIAMTVLLIIFAATGNMIFRAFGITLSAFRTAGGHSLVRRHGYAAW
jgi:multiple antibiotic resistance protein